MHDDTPFRGYVHNFAVKLCVVITRVQMDKKNTLKTTRIFEF